jgi:hypothetical protein
VKYISTGVQKVLRAKSSFKRQSGELPAGDVTAHQSIAANSTGSQDRRIILGLVDLR